MFAIVAGPAIAFLVIQGLAGAALAFRPFSLNMWEPSDGFDFKRDWLSVGTGILFLLGAGLGWYGYFQNLHGWCFGGASGFSLLRRSVNMLAAAFALALVLQSRGQTSKVHVLRNLLCWNFALCSAICFSLGLWLTIGTLERHGAILPLRVWLVNGVLPAEATIFAVSWWRILKGRSSFRFWGVSGSVLNILNATLCYAFGSRLQWLVLVVGIAGIVVFSLRDEGTVQALAEAKQAEGE